MNIKLHFLYRDTLDNKILGSVVFSNPDRMIFDVIHHKIIVSLTDGQFLVPEELRLCRLSHCSLDSYDHEWNEYHSLEETTDAATDRRTIKSFLRMLESARRVY